MGNRLEIIRAEPGHADDLGPRIRPEEQLEVWASCRRSARDALELSRQASDEAYTILVDGQIAAMYGAAAIASGEAAVGWLLCSDLIERVPVAFCKLCRSELARLQARWPRLINAIDARYGRALRWAEWLKGRLGPPVPFGVGREPFRWVQFERSV